MYLLKNLPNPGGKIIEFHILSINYRYRFCFNFPLSRINKNFKKGFGTTFKLNYIYQVFIYFNFLFYYRIRTLEYRKGARRFSSLSWNPLIHWQQEGKN
jgi:hypothetical protein